MSDPDDYLEEFLRPTSSSWEKLLAAWDGLTVETQIKLLKRYRPGYSIRDELVVKALGSPSSYVRYLAARRAEFYVWAQEDTPEVVAEKAAKAALRKRIEDDADELVRHAPDEAEGIGLRERPSADEFWRMPRGKRLAIARSERPPTCEEFSTYVLHALSERMPDRLVGELIEEYVDGLSRRWRRDGGSWYLGEKDLESLWSMVVKVPGWIASYLAEFLPLWRRTASWGSDRDEVPNWIVEQMRGRALCAFLQRPEVGRSSLRKQILKSSQYDEDEKAAAAVPESERGG